MKKLILSLLTLSLISTVSFAEPVCANYELSWIHDSRYISTGSNVTSESIIIDNETLKIDKKNKTIQVWAIFVSNEEGKSQRLEQWGDKYVQYGYSKYLYLINYSKKLLMIKSISEYSCNGGTLTNANNPNKADWNDIVPDSSNEAILKTIMKKYNLK